jgi:hypothetical protein
VRIAVAFELGEECLLAVRARELGSGREMEAVFTTKGTPDEVKKRLERDAGYVAAGVAPPGVAPPPAGAALPAAPAEADPSAAKSAGLKGLWSRITGR